MSNELLECPRCGKMELTLYGDRWAGVDGPAEWPSVCAWCLAESARRDAFRQAARAVRSVLPEER